MAAASSGQAPPEPVSAPVASSARRLQRLNSTPMEIVPQPLTTAASDEQRRHYLATPAHAVRDSLFHSKSDFSDFRGFINLGLMCLVAACFRVVVENFSKYGILINPLTWITFFLDKNTWPCLALLVLLSVFLLLAVHIELLAARKVIGPKVVLWLHGLNIVGELLVPCVVILALHPHPAASAGTMFEVSIVFMKLISYVSVNKYYRTREGVPESERESDPDGKLVRYPANLTVANMCYFAWAPTLCYELNFPRTPRIRKRFLIRRVLECLVFTVILLSLGQQWIAPTVLNTWSASEITFSHLLQRVLKLALPNIFLWLIAFYLYFHAFLNVCGELLCFGDRQFYRDWWNATTVTYFWRNWNIPVHKWLSRHVYRPCMLNGYSKLSAALAVFMLSALFHEILVSVPLCMFKSWAFLGMLVQIPLALASDRFLSNTVYGNVVVWSSLLIGQPIAILLYVQAYVAQTHTI